MPRAKYWGHIVQSDNAALDSAAARFKRRVRKLKSATAVEREIRSFLKEYMAIGEDPTDTVIRDNVWVFLLAATKGKLTENELDQIWRSEMDGGGRCVIC